MQRYLHVDYCGYSAQTAVEDRQWPYTFSPDQCQALVATGTTRITDMGGSYEICGQKDKTTTGNYTPAGQIKNPEYPQCVCGNAIIDGQPYPYHVIWVEWTVTITVTAQLRTDSQTRLTLLMGSNSTTRDRRTVF